MKKLLTASIIILSGMLVLFGAFFFSGTEKMEDNAQVRPMDGELNEDPVETKIARQEYFFNLLRDPATNRIPPNIRDRELNHARTLPSSSGPTIQSGAFGQASATSGSFSWASVGPNTLGGRTRALEIDQTDPQTIIAGGVSGGIWKSTDGGNNWTLKTDPQQNMSVTYVEQDPTTPTTWYYASGEIRGNSAGDRGFRARYFGTGIWKSIDNGETWTRLSATEDTDTGWNSRYDFITKIVISPTTGTIFAASNGWGILRSTDDGGSFNLVQGAPGEHRYVGLDVASDGTVVAVLSENDACGGCPNNPGVFVSADDGQIWTEVTPSSFPTSHNRSVVDFAPSDTTIFYTFTDKNASSNQGVSFHKFNLNSAGDDTSSTDDRSANLPDFGGLGVVNTQGSYNMVVSVKPDDPDFVLVGGTNLFRSRDGFATAPGSGEEDEYWIGGYGKTSFIYPNQHPDQHVVAFDPTKPDTMYAGHDGGLSQTTDVTASSVTWSDRDDGYITSQFYTVALPESASDDRIMGGTQDNGTPYYRVDPGTQQQTTTFTDISSGDGSYAHFTDNYFFVSSQRGRVVRRSKDTNGDPTGFDLVDPDNASSPLFIHPFEMDPHLESIMYYPGDDTMMYRNKQMNQDAGTISNNWNSFDAIPDGTGYNITTLEATVNPTPVDLYYAASSFSVAPKIFLLSDARNSTSPTDISISAAPSGAYVHDIAVNPSDKQELIVVMSNYNITGIYHSTNAGSNWQAIEGNLTGSSTDPGPSIRSATIVPTSSGKVYFVATSTGVFMTDALSGSSTTWTRQAPNTLGFAVSEYITSRTSDNLVAVGTHGRGIYTAKFTSTVAENDSIPPTAPANLFTAVGSSSINLDWDPSSDSESGVNNYIIYRGTDSHSDSLAVHDSVGATNTSYSDSKNISFEPFYYRVTAKDGNGNESDSSGLASVYRDSLPLTGDWQLISSPLDSGLSANLPSGASIIGFNGAYQITNNIGSPAGYWIKGDSASPGTIVYDNRSLTADTITVKAGWNLIGSLGDTISAADISDPNNVLSAADIQEYSNGTYSATTTLVPSAGYWIHADMKGDIILSLPAVQSGSSPEVGSDRNPVTVRDPGQYDEIMFVSEDASQILRASGSTLTAERKQRYLRPPLAPEPVLDVRTADDYGIADAERTELDLTVSSYPVTVSLDAEAAGTYRLVGISNNDEVYYPLEPGQSRRIERGYDRLYLERLTGREASLKNELLPNYPNPFNPATTIKYQLASREKVSLQVFDILGREVRTLVDKQQQPGNYTVRFDASRLSSGMYFVRIRAGSFTQIQKMTLIK